MPRYKLTVAYEGTEFHGWQKQEPPDVEPLRTVQGVLEETVRSVVRGPVTLLGASRTDSGVHARGQIAAFSCDLELSAEQMRRAINARLPADVQVVAAAETHETFNPISDALAKGYRYRLAYGGMDGAPAPLFDRRIRTFAPYDLDPIPMNEAARLLIGEHDFTSFTRKNHGRESTVRTVYDCQVNMGRTRRLRIDVCGNGFLYNMVRIIAGTLIEVGRGRISPDAVPDVLAARDRDAAGPTLPPEGLCLMWVKYR